MKSFTNYRVNQPDTTSGHSISVTTTIFGTEEEVEYIRRSCEETIGSGLLQEYSSPLTSQFRGFNQGQVVHVNNLEEKLKKAWAGLMKDELNMKEDRRNDK